MKSTNWERYYGSAVVIAALSLFSASCGIVKTKEKTAAVPAVTDASQADLMKEVDRFAKVDSMRAKMYLKFEDNSFAAFGSKEVYREAPGEVVVQRPAKIRLKVSVPVVGSDVAQMTSDGETFRVAILQDGAGGKFKKFVKGTNNADYSKLQKTLSKEELEDAKNSGQKVNAFANLRPQHFTDALLVRPIDQQANLYTQSTIYEAEEDTTQSSKSPTRMVMRGFYLLDEFARLQDGGLMIKRRFWFDRVGAIRLARQQIFDKKGEIESDIVYGKQGNLTDTPDYANLPLEILVTRPKERYAMRLTYQSPVEVTIGTKFPDTAFVLENSWGLEEVDLDKKLREALQANPNANTKIATNHDDK
ncbi:MAG: hypothetical protein JO053_12780 [Acidobacteria bacterium]|nr:hypothetical protein [Acidobacteriota bacterium]